MLYKALLRLFYIRYFPVSRVWVRLKRTAHFKRINAEPQKLHLLCQILNHFWFVHIFSINSSDFLLNVAHVSLVVVQLLPVLEVTPASNSIHLKGALVARRADCVLGPQTVV